MNKKQTAEPGGIKVIAVNRKARFQYHIVEDFEAGIVLTGAEIKSVRQGNVNLSDSYVSVRRGELWLLNAHIGKYAFHTDLEYDPTRARKLLMHRREIERLRGQIEQKGFTAVPLQLYLKRGYAKLQIALAKGKDAPDKRQAVRDRETKREAQRAMKQRSRD